jgi:hypothetical protein
MRQYEDKKAEEKKAEEKKGRGKEGREAKAAKDEGREGGRTAPPAPAARTA